MRRQALRPPIELLLPCSLLLIAQLIGSGLSADEPGPTREEKVRADRARAEAEGFWIYNDLPAAYEEARQSGKPILVSMRCLPCDECVKLDDDLIDNDPIVKPLLEQFVCVRIVGTNGLDLDTFQYDTDQSFAMFMINADKVVYGRFGTRSHRTDWLGDVSVQGMAEALRGVLALHQSYPGNKDQLVGKKGEPLEFPTPEQYPSLRDKYTDRLDYQGDVVKSCIHCHQIGDARRDHYWSQGQPIPEDLLFPYPHPKSIGLILDPTKRARVKQITANSPSASSGLIKNDNILRINGQPIVSMADVQWILHHTPSEGGELSLLVRRAGKNLPLTLELATKWRRLDNPRWRVSAWGFSRMMLGGMRLDELSNERRKELGIEAPMALEATSVGKYGAHATAKRAGFRPGDIVVGYDGRTDLLREADIFAYASETHVPGDRIRISYFRNGKQLEATLPIQK